MDSRIKHLQRIITLLAIFLCLNAFNMVNMVNVASGSGEWFAYLTLGMVSAVVVLLVYGMARLTGMKKRLEKERQLHE